jgi:hypothetical protein
MFLTKQYPLSHTVVKRRSRGAPGRDALSSSIQRKKRGGKRVFLAIGRTILLPKHRVVWTPVGKTLVAVRKIHARQHDLRNLVFFFLYMNVPPVAILTLVALTLTRRLVEVVLGRLGNTSTLAPVLDIDIILIKLDELKPELV